MKKIIFRVGGSSSAANPPPPPPPPSAVAGGSKRPSEGEGSGAVGPALPSTPNVNDQIYNSLAVGDGFINWGVGKRPRRKLKSRYCRRATPRPSGFSGGSSSGGGISDSDGTVGFPVYRSRNLEDNGMVVGGGNSSGVGGSSILTSVLGKRQRSGAESSDRKKIPSSSSGPSKKHRPNDSTAQPQQPGIVIQLTKEEKEEDFLKMRGAKLPQKPMRRPRNVEKNLLYCFPGMFFSDVSSSKYEVVEEKKRSRKSRRSGLKGIVESSDSDEFTNGCQ